MYRFRSVAFFHERGQRSRVNRRGKDEGQARDGREVREGMVVQDRMGRWEI